MPQYGNQDYKSAVFEQLSQGLRPAGRRGPLPALRELLAGAPRRDVEAGVGEAFHPERVSSEEVEPQFRTAAEKMKPHERSEIAQDLMGELQQRGPGPDAGSRSCSASASADPSQASPDDVAKLTEYSRQNHPEVFQRVMADKPFLVRWLDKPLVAAPGRRDRRQAAQPPVRQVIQSPSRSTSSRGGFAMG